MAFKATAEIVHKYAVKGTQVGVWGRAQVDKYTGKDGQPKERTVIIVDHLQLLARPTQTEQTQAAAAVVAERAVLDDLPF